MTTYAQLTAAGVSPRRIEWWTRKGHLRTYDTNPGTGNSREWRPGESRIGRDMVRFVDEAGLTPEAAHRAARGEALAPGIRLAVDEAVPEYSDTDIKRAIQELTSAGFYGEIGHLDEKTLGRIAVIVLDVYRDGHQR